MKKIKNKIKSRNPFYKELAALSHKVLKNKKKYSRKGKNIKNMSGLHTQIYTPPSGPCAGARWLSICFYWTIKLPIIYTMRPFSRAYIMLISNCHSVFFPTTRHTRGLTIATFFRCYFSPTLLMAHWRIFRPHNNTGLTRKTAAVTIAQFIFGE